VRVASTRPLACAHGSARDQLVQLMDVDDVWFSELQSTVGPSSASALSYASSAATSTAGAAEQPHMKRRVAPVAADLPIRLAQRNGWRAGAALASGASSRCTCSSTARLGLVWRLISCITHAGRAAGAAGDRARPQHD
jgi:hypothetical protein